MSLLLSILLNDIFPILVVATTGFVLARRLRVDVKMLSRVTFNALAPCLVFHLIVTSSVTSGEAWRLAIFTVGLVLSMGLLARLVAWPFGLDRQMLAAFLIVVMFSNAGNYGLSVILFAFGRDVLARAAIYFVVSAVMMYTLGVFIASSGHRSVWQALAGVARVPAVYAAATA
jgi:predicted permease